MQDRTINSALLDLRKQIIRGNQDGRDQVEALLTMRGVRLPRVLPPRPPNAVRQWQMQRMVLDALSKRSMGIGELVQHLAPLRPDVPSERLYWRTASCLNRMRGDGLVRREGRVWGLDR